MDREVHPDGLSSPSMSERRDRESVRKTGGSRGWQIANKRPQVAQPQRVSEQQAFPAVGKGVGNPSITFRIHIPSRIVLEKGSNLDQQPQLEHMLVEFTGKHRRVSRRGDVVMGKSTSIDNEFPGPTRFKAERVVTDATIHSPPMRVVATDHSSQSKERALEQPRAHTTKAPNRTSAQVHTFHG